MRLSCCAPRRARPKTLTRIAFEKAGIARRIPLVTQPYPYHAATEVKRIAAPPPAVHAR
jgi:folylpolyglutamate synthase/dihydropteroate synthase